MLESLKGSPLAAFLAALLVTLICTPMVRQLALRAGAVAKPDARRLHSGEIAQWGGLALFLGVVAAALVWRQPTPQDLRLLAPSSNPAAIRQTVETLHLSTTFFLCGGAMLLLGMLDDRFELRAWQKFGGQVVIVYFLWRSGVKVTTLPFTAGTQALSDEISLLLTMLWVLGLTNGLNFIDGVDGLAAGVGAIAAGTLSLIELDKAPWAACALAALCGACIGFLRFNFHPAKIFLGDAGALLLGFWLATIALAAAAKTAAATTLALPLLVLGIPILDTVWAIFRRALAGKAPWVADRGHIHHRLLSKGLSPVKTVLVIYAVGLVLGATALLFSRS
ncbi:MAG: undecaprenyl/decaprenyl-phosphate alpha-N-acetylglucosaminyl 1-phosphate transferase [Armatimonadetes bacterium]|nr:undecaprenyl/decaprenyl-phosphate alpha-N-acetylglucosaminyl 1-phosphate transferase [Armatimonadota bacterium]